MTGHPAPRAGAAARALASVLAGSLVIVAAAQADPTLRWDPDGTQLAPGEQATLAVMLDDTLDVRTLELLVTYDPAVLATVDGGPGALFDGLDLFVGFSEPVPGQWSGYAVILGADVWATGPGELFTITVEALAAGVSPLQTVTVTLLPPGGGDYPETTLPDSEVLVIDPTGAPVPGATALRLQLAPNPFNPRTRLTLRAAQDGPAELQVLTVRGQLVARPWRGLLRAGRDRLVDWDGTGPGGQALPSGVYRFRLVGSGGAVVSRTGVLVR